MVFPPDSPSPLRRASLLLRFALVAVVMARFACAGRASGVLVEICEQGLNDKDAWPKTPPDPTESFEAPAFALASLPPKYVDDGLRGSRPSPSLVRFSASIDLPAGTHRLLIRARGAARLVINGSLVAETPFPPVNGGDGSQADTERLVPLDIGPGFRFAPRGEYERLAEWSFAGGRAAVIYEVFAGGREGKNPRRVELGETVVALQKSGTATWEMLSPSSDPRPYTDAGWESISQSVARSLERESAGRRAALRENNDPYWEKRREAAKAWLDAAPPVAVPALPEGHTASNPIDHFLAEKLVSVKAQNKHTSPDAVDFFREVKPLLESRCIECHRGVKAKSGLRLDSRNSALQGGDSDPSLSPGDSAKSELIKRITSKDEDEVMPPKGSRLTAAETTLLARWIQEGASWPELPLVRSEPAPPAGDEAFLRRVMLDTVGVPPTLEERQSFLEDTSPARRSALIDKLLDDPRRAGHWMPFWQDLLAENPNILNPTLNNTGPFRWWLLDALTDDLPLDRMVTQLILQRGGEREGGPAGFGEASQNDSPFAAKAAIVSSTFLGVEMKCARCHDSPTGAFKQEQLFQLGALLATQPLTVPRTSSVDPVKLTAGGRKPLIEVTLMPGSTVAPAWPFSAFAGAELAASMAENPADPRERLAALITAPQNERFAQVMANRIWQRFMGRGLVEPLDDWEKGAPTHPELLRWLGRELVREGYQVKALARLILNSAAYQRSVDATLHAPDALYTAAEPRRLSAEQVVDSLFAATGKTMRTEPLCLDLNGRREVANGLDLGTPGRAWMLASLSNERDRASLTLPRLQAVFDVMSAFGWRGARQDPASSRDSAPNALQPAILANGLMCQWITRLSDDHPLTALALRDQPVEALVEALFLRLLSRKPGADEAGRCVDWLKTGYEERKVASPEAVPAVHAAPQFVTWTNHLQPESEAKAHENAEAARKGDPATSKLEPAWRSRCEDVIWALINSPEMLYRP